MTLTNVQVVNESLQLIGTQKQITSLTDGSPSASAANVLYVPVVTLLLRTLDPDFARLKATLTSASASPVPPWDFEYQYPTDCIRLRQVCPAQGSYDPNDPQPVRSYVAYDSGANNTSKKVILTNQANALAVYTSSTVTELNWDSAFQEAVVRKLGNPLAMALAGRPDFAKELLEEAWRAAQVSDSVDESVVRPS